MSTENSNTNLASRTQRLSNAHVNDGKCVAYVMSRDQRVQDNHALIAAQKRAKAEKLPLTVIFCLRDGKGNRAKEHYLWMLKGLRQVEVDLCKLNIPFMMLIGEPEERLTSCTAHIRPSALYFDYSPLSGSRKLQQAVSLAVDCEVYVVDTHNTVPVLVASDKQEYAARTIRPKIHRHLEDYLEEPDKLLKHPHSWPGVIMKIDDLKDKIDDILDILPSNGQNNLQETFSSGELVANKALNDFIKNRLAGYVENRNDPSKDGLSGLSPYLHFGQLSALRVVLEITVAVTKNASLQAGADVLIEEMVVRKELSDNFCHYNQDYKKLSGAPEWAQKTLEKHGSDDRDFLYTREQFERGQTHDPAWNAAQLQMVRAGKMHGYMRMYWAKKVLEWSATPKEALETLIYLNDFYSIDGGDPNGYVGILWSVAGVHDRPWGERAVYGTIRSMVYNGLKRKFDIKVYEAEYLS